MAGHSTDGIGFLSNLAQVVERYELSKALLPQSYFWMENLKGQADFAPEVLWFAFAFGHAEAFCYATKDLMNHYSGTRFADKYVWGRHISPPEGLFGKRIRGNVVSVEQEADLLLLQMRSILGGDVLSMN